MHFTQAIEHRCYTCNKLFFKGIFAVGILEIKCNRCGHVSLLNAFTDIPGQDERSYTLVYNSKGKIVLATDNAIKHLGYSRAELMSLTIPEISPRNQLYAVPKNSDDATLQTWEEYHTQLTSDIIHCAKDGARLTLKATFHTVASASDYFTIGVYQLPESTSD